MKKTASSIISWVATAILALFVLVSGGLFSKLLFLLALLAVIPINPIREFRETIHVRGAVAAILAVALFVAGCLVSPSPENDAADVSAAFVAATDTPAPTATPKPTAPPELTPEPAPTPERVRGWLADTEVYISSSNGIVHSRSSCSGMKYYWTTTIKAADEAGYEFCEKCW